MDEFSDQLARLRAHIDGQRALPPDLGMWVVDELSRIAGSNELRMRRNSHLCRAGAMIGGSLRNRALAILRETRALERTAHFRSFDSPDATPLRAEVRAARLLASIPAERQLRDILATGDDTGEMLAGGGMSIANESAQHLHREHTRNRSN